MDREQSAPRVVLVIGGDPASRNARTGALGVRGVSVLAAGAVLDPAASGLLDEPTATPCPGPRPLSVLVVEDEEDSAESLAELIRMSGHLAGVARTGAEALRCAADAPDVVLLDMRLPDMDGCEVARTIGAATAPKRPFLVAVTGRGTDDDFRRSEDAGIDLHLIKPVEPAALLALLARFARVVG